MTDVNYSSARIAELAEREMWMVLQDWLIHTLIEPIYQEWLASALIRGDITFEQSGKALPADRLAKFSAASRFQGRRWKWVDPSKEIEAAKAAVELGITSRTRIAAEQGVDLDDVLDELEQEDRLMDAKGLKPAAPVAVAPPPQPDPKDDDVAKALRQIAELLARQPAMQVHNHVAPAAVTVAPAEVHNHVAPATVQIPVEVNVPERSVNLEAVFQQPAPASETTTIERDAAHEAVRTTKTFTYREPMNG